MEGNKMKIGIYNHLTGEDIVRDMTAEEIAQYEAEKEAENSRKAEIKSETEAKESARQALLDKLGITQEEAQLLLGGN